MTMSSENLRFIVLHVLGAGAFIFVLNYFVLNTGMQSSLIWTVGFGAMAGFVAWQQIKRRGS
jgi:hypothetical protein